MTSLQQDILLDDTAFASASADMKDLAARTEQLKEKMEKMYDDLSSALQTPAGEALELTAKNILIQPIDNLKLVVDHISATLEEIKGSGYYKDVFIKYEDLNKNITVK